MDISPTAALRLLLPRAPLILKTAVFNALSLSKNSSKQGTFTEVAVVVLRSMLSIKKPLGFIQRIGLKDPGIKGPIWISKATILAPDDAGGLRSVLDGAIKALGDGSESYTLPDICNVEGEWTGHRGGVDKNAARLEMSEDEQYDHLQKEVSSPVTILYFHGGAYFLMDPSSHRAVTSRLAKMTGGRCFSVRYRLAPQHPFPAQLLDALVSYLYLLSPPAGAHHQAVPAKHIIFAGDSAGGNLCLALLQLLLTLQRTNVTTLRFNNQTIPVVLPAGLALNSPWCDITRSMPSIRSNAHFDYLDPPSMTGIPDPPLVDSIWPTSPPRAEIFCSASLLTHPLVSPLAADARLWTGMPPTFMCAGNEGLEDEIAILARRMFQAGGAVHFVGYEGMPHCFGLMFADSVMGRDCFERWAGFCVDAVAGTLLKTEVGLWVTAFSNPPQATKLSLSDISSVSDEEVRSRMEETKRKTLEYEKTLLKEWEAQQSRARL